MTDKRWPELDYVANTAVIETCHAYLQVVGKLPTRAKPWCNHGWQLALRVVPRGFRTYPIVAGEDEAEVLFDCLTSEVLVETSAGFRSSFTVTGQTVAQFLAEFQGLLREAGINTAVSGAPNEVDPAIPFADDMRERSWDAETARRIHAAFRSADRVFEQFRSAFVGKSSPSHLFWGSFDLAVSRFSGRESPLHPGGFPNLPDRVTREAYSHEVASAGFWLGGGGIDEAAFYAYGYPSPEGVGDAQITIPGTYWHSELGEFLLPYSAVREAPDPDAKLLDFLEQTYTVIAERGGWDRRALEIPQGALGEPYDVIGARGLP
ncbi:MAG: DUF5996 family protein [Pseudomonadota bacterium]